MKQNKASTQQSEVLSTKLGTQYRKRIVISVSLVGVIVSLCYSAILWTQYQQALSSFTDFLYALCYAGTFYWVRQEKFVLSAYWLILIASLQVTLGSIFFVGAETGFQLYFLSLPVVVYFLLNDQEKWKKLAVMLYGCLCFCAAHTLRVETYMAPIPPSIAQGVFIGNALIVFLIVVSAVKFFSDEMLNAYNEQQKFVLTDNLTGIANLRFVQQYASKLLSQADRYGHPISLIHFDIDHFSQINTEQGLDAGNRSLEFIAQLVKNDIRDADIIARIGGDEFVIILPESNAQDAKQVAERLSQLIKSRSYELKESNVSFSANFGISYCDSSNMKSIDDLIREASS